MEQIQLLRSGNRIVVSPTTDRVRDTITPHLTYSERVFYRGYERARRVKLNLPTQELVEWECYGNDHKERVATSFGFCELIKEKLESRGYEVKVRWATKAEKLQHKHRLNTVYKPDWSRLDELVKDGFKYRYKQKEALQAMVDYPNGRIDCHTGWGKGTQIMLAAMLFPTATIDVVTKRIPILHTRLYPELAMNLPSVGIVGGGKKILGKRVMCLSADSIHYGRPNADFVFVDEGHEACADKFAEGLARYEHARMWAFSASWDQRLDNKDLRGLAIFGPIRVRVSYEEGVEHGIVVPIEVHWTDVIMDHNPASGVTDNTERKRLAIWTNEYRNSLIAADARKYGPDTQVLITVETIEHVLHLAKLLPEYKVAYSGQSLSEKALAKFRRDFPDQWVDMTREKLDKRARRFTKGLDKKVIANTVWNVGVDFRHLEVLIRGDGGGSSINDTQIPGRNSRKKKAEDIAKGAKEKFVGRVHDYLDQFDPPSHRKANGRGRNYAKNKWVQKFPEKRSRRHRS